MSQETSLIKKENWYEYLWPSIYPVVTATTFRIFQFKCEDICKSSVKKKGLNQKILVSRRIDTE